MRAVFCRLNSKIYLPTRYECWCKNGKSLQGSFGFKTKNKDKPWVAAILMVGMSAQYCPSGSTASCSTV